MRALVGVLLVLQLSTARADDAATLVDEAMRAYTELFAESLALLDRAWRLGDSDAVHLRRIFSLAGQVAASMDDRAEAVVWFERWLSLDHDADLPVGTSPKLTELVAQARAELHGAGLAAHAKSDRTQTIVSIDNDPVGLVAAVRLGRDRRELVGKTIVLPPSEQGVELLDRHGNILARVAVWHAPPPAPPPPPLPRRGGWHVWALTAGALAVIGGIAYFVAADAHDTIVNYDKHSSEHRFSDVLPYDRRLELAQWTSGSAFSAAAVSAVIGGVLWQRERGDSITVAASRRGASVTWSITF